jgi:2-oxoglutarate ferredoxin oxidoreductase subunit alpha
MNGTNGKMIIDGNAASALGLLYGGASVVAWYPITPSSSVVENFSKYASQIRKTNDGKNNFAVIQAEDELASICMVLGAGFAGARSFTATSGPGLSLMQEAAGYAYYTEIPSVIWNVQRVGPSTGMPTRTAQGDLYSAVLASHGDTKHPVLIPADPKECFEFGQTCFDLAERLQTLVIVLSDLDIGMNLWMQDEFSYPTKSFDRGKTLTAEELSKIENYARYQDVDGDGIPYRTLPGTKHPAAPYVVRGSGHGNRAQYTEKANEYRDIVDRLVVKWETARTLVPKPVVDNQGSKIGILTYGSADAAMPEARDFMNKQNLKTDYMRVRAIPFSSEIREFIQNHDRVYIIDLNRDAQMMGLLRMEMPELHEKMLSITHYDGTPITADYIAKTILNKESK